MGSAMMDLMFRDACMNLSNGIVNPLDKDILSYAPLPDSVIDPYITQEVDPLQTMNLTNNTLKVWVEESKKANYFTTHFVTLSRMIMNGVATMARGLVTLHMRGEDLDQAPLSIQDLLSISSYQFRKSYIGVLQTVKSKPEVSERLLMNQLRWNNTLIKLFKTREKLERPVVSGQCSVISAQGLENDEGKNNNEVPHIDLESSNSLDDEKALTEAEIKSIADPNVSSLESGSSEISSVETDVSPLTELSELPALAAPGAYGAIRAYGTLENKKAEKKKQSGARSQGQENEEGRRKKKMDSESSESESQEQGARSKGTGNEESRMKNEANLESSESGSQEQGTRSKGTGNEEGRVKNEVNLESSESGSQEQGARDQDGSGDEDDSSLDETGQNYSDAHGDRHACAGCAAHGDRHACAGYAAQDASPHVLREEMRRPPEYARVLYRALCRSSGNEDGALEFTLDEIYQLLGDPEFCRYEPQLAADFRKALQAAGK